MKYIHLLSTCFVLLAGCKSGSKTAEPETEAVNETRVTLTDVQLKNAGIVTGKIVPQEISTILKVNGKIDVPPQNLVSISVPLGGYLKTSHLLPGMHINKGEVIAVMEDQQYIQLQQDYLMARAKLPALENEYKRQKELNQSQAASDKIYQQAESDYKTQQVLITSLSEKLKLAGINTATISNTHISASINIRSPINGYVSAVNVNIGKYVSPTEVLFELINPTDIHLALNIFEKDLGRLSIGQHLVAYTNNQPGKKYPCEIILIGKDLSKEGNTQVHCHFESYDKTLVPGTFMNAEIEIKSNTAAALPADAIVRFEGKQYVYKMIGPKQFEMVEVRTGETENGFTAITIENPDLVKEDFVIKGAYTLLMMMKNKEE